jgi:hypothetical protein
MRTKKHAVSGKAMKRRGAPTKDPEDRLDVPKTIKFNRELEQRLRAMAKDEKGSKAVNSLVRRLCDEGTEQWMKEKGWTDEDIAKVLGK